MPSLSSEWPSSAFGLWARVNLFKIYGFFDIDPEEVKLDEDEGPEDLEVRISN